ncbi:MAG: hypothetical protein RLY86_660 [Pseudomonadota bacterium]|jgi:putative transposase
MSPPPKMQGLTASEIATALNLSTRAVELRAQRESWVYRDGKKGRNRCRMYLVMPLPGDVKELVVNWMASQAAVVMDSQPPAVNGNTPGLPAPTLPDLPTHQLADWQRRCLEARAALLMELRRLAGEAGLNAAVAAMVRHAAAGTLRSDLLALVPAANARGGAAGGRTLSVPTLKRWWGVWKKAGYDPAVLAPVDAKPAPEIPAWGPAFLAQYRRPSNPSVTDAVEKMTLPAQVQRPSVHQARRFLATLSPVDRERGRRSPQALRALRPFVRRTTDHLEPLDVITADGHTAKFDVAHPIHGRPFRPEITVVIDVATRRAIGWSVGYAESTWTVMDAYGHAYRSTGKAAIAYTDNGSGFVNQINAGPLIGLMARLGTTHETGRPGNPQGRGLIERSWQKLFIQPAKRLAAFAGKDMDRDARKKVVKITERHLQDHGASPLLMSWPEFIAWVGERVADYNAKGHRALGGKSPDAAWAAHENRGWEPIRLTAEEADSLFRPHEIRTAQRAEISLHGNRYFHAALEHHHGQQVQVGFDIHDPARVWVRTMDGILICVAEADGNARPYFDKVAIDRAKNRLKPVERKRAEIRAELEGSLGSGAVDAEWTPAPEELAAAEARQQQLEGPRQAPADPDPGARPVFGDDIDWGAWVLANPGKATEFDKRRFDTLARTSLSFRLALGLEDGVEQSAG